jgi:hypothetical protein
MERTPKTGSFPVDGGGSPPSDTDFRPRVSQALALSVVPRSPNRGAQQ